MARRNEGRRAQGQPELYLTMALKYLARRDRTKAEVMAYLSRRGAGDGSQRAVVHKLARLGYLDDRRFAEAWAQAQLRRRPMGRERLKAELISKGVEDQGAEEAVQEAFRAVSERDTALQALRQRTVLTSSTRSARFLQRRGFDEETIREVLGMEVNGERDGL